VKIKQIFFNERALRNKLPLNITLCFCNDGDLTHVVTYPVDGPHIFAVLFLAVFLRRREASVSEGSHSLFHSSWLSSEPSEGGKSVRSFQFPIFVTRVYLTRLIFNVGREKARTLLNRMGLDWFPGYGITCCMITYCLNERKSENKDPYFITTK
jgi:hypothetical protein